MATQLIFTVGTNALPIWVAWYHLKDKLEAPIKVRLVHTTDTEPQKEVLEDYCEGADFLDPIKTDSGDPNVVREYIQDSILDGFSKGTLHVHYTGGTKVMGVETVSAIESMIMGTNYSLETSYLDPRENDGPRIVRRSDAPSRSGELVPDTRIDIPVEPAAGDPDHIALIRIAKLNGFEIGPCSYIDRNGGNADCPEPVDPSEAYITDGQRHVKNHFSSYTGQARDKGPLLEYAAYGSFQKALYDICKDSSDRCNSKIFHSVKGIRSGARKHFELDVVAILGHQVVLVSCDARDAQEAPIKRKAVEAYHRAKQLGGDEARAVMLCNLSGTAAEIVQEELQDETGSPDVPLKVWGNDVWTDLTGEFTDYLTDELRWE